MLETPFIFKLNDNGTGPNLLCQVFLERGWQELADKCSKDQWNIWWRTSGFPISQYKALKSWQFTNHVPKASAICRKDYLCRHLKFMRNNYGNIFDFRYFGFMSVTNPWDWHGTTHPKAFILPLDYIKLVDACSRLSIKSEKDDIWICKPVGQSQGKGISLFRKISELTYATNTVVQRYVKNPLLIGGYKFDLRLYVCVPCFHPLTVYIYREGLARFCSDKFSLSDLKNRYAHLTNSSLNKQGPGYSEMKDKVGAGCKWSLKQLRYYLNQNGYDDWLLWQRISHLIVLTISTQAPGVPQTSNCFEFYGFDVLIDDSLKPWLLEVNISPALGTDCDVDPAVKKPMLHDMFDLLGLPVCNMGLSLFTDLANLESQTPEENLNIYSTVHKAASVVAMAHKWKNHVTPISKSVDRKVRRSSGLGRKSPSSRRQSALTTCIVGEYTGRDTRYGVKKDIFGEIDPVKNRPFSMWDNGVNWNRPPREGGDWVRAYPFTSNPQWDPWKQDKVNVIPEKAVRTMVLECVKVSKAAREAQKVDSTDEAKDNYLLQSLVCDAVWHPYN